MLWAKNLLFLDQLRDEDYLFTWKQLHINSRFSQQGKIPKWWNIIEERVLKDNSRIIKDEYNSSNDVNSNQMFNEQLLMPTKIDGRKNTWIISKQQHTDWRKQVIIGTLQYKSWNLTESDIEIIHFKFKRQDNWKLILEKCNNPNCNIGHKDLNNNCIVKVERNRSLKLNDKLVKEGDIYKLNQS